MENYTQITSKSNVAHVCCLFVWECRRGIIRTIFWNCFNRANLCVVFIFLHARQILHLQATIEIFSVSRAFSILFLLYLAKEWAKIEEKMKLTHSRTTTPSLVGSMPSQNAFINVGIDIGSLWWYENTNSSVINKKGTLSSSLQCSQNTVFNLCYHTTILFYFIVYVTHILLFPML